MVIDPSEVEAKTPSSLVMLVPLVQILATASIRRHFVKGTWTDDVVFNLQIVKLFFLK